MENVYVIAEAGVNHNGDISMALELVKKAKWAGADCVKFQTFKAESIVTRSSPKASYQLKATDNKESQFEMLKALELNLSDYKILKNECDKLGIDFMSTPYDYDDVDFLNDLGIVTFKIASSQLTEILFLEYVAKKKKRVILSTGMATLAEVFDATQAVKAYNQDLIVLQCTTNYPSLIEESNINAMLSIEKACGVKIGYSDHVQNNYACYSAVSLGAKVIEKHFTLDKSLPGPDHSCSLIPEEFKEMIYGIRQIEKSLGNGIKTTTANEMDNIFAMRRSIVASKNLKKGDQIEVKSIAFKRPFSGLAPKELKNILGKKLNKNISIDSQIQFNDFE
tara:strand:+ start:4453 stop:5460 length:1008 start_codon:yes stop_codon:yes gene_type:complete